MLPNGNFDYNSMQPAQWQQPPSTQMIGEGDEEGISGLRRPPNAFILYSQTMRSKVRQENPSLSNTEASKLLGKMWKEVPADQKAQYKIQAQKLQDSFKKEHPDYTYAKARRKRALNDILNKNATGNYPYLGMPVGFPMPGQMPGQMPFSMPGQAMPLMQPIPNQQMQVPMMPQTSQIPQQQGIQNGPMQQVPMGMGQQQFPFNN